jgi:hypothetical protein
MAVFTTVLTSDLKKPLEVIALDGVFFTSDAQANIIAVDVLDNGSPATLSGTVKGYVILPDHSTLPTITGTLSGNRASITLPANAYVLEGQISIVIKLETGSGSSAVKTALGACTGYVCRTTTTTSYDPGGVTPSVEDLEYWIEQCQTASGEASDAADKLENMDATATSLAADASPTASISTVSGHYRLSLGIPVGVPPDFSIGTVQSGQTAAVTMTGTATAPVLNFVLPKGDTGATGATGETGATGATPQFSIGTVQKGDAAAATITGTAAQPVLNLTLPKGDPGAAGTPGATGSTPALSVGTVTTGNPGTNASVTISGTNEAPVLNFTIPRGAQGAPGPVGSVNGISPDSEGDVALTASDITAGTLPAAQMTVMTGASGSASGVKGAVPAPLMGEQDKVLTGAGVWMAAGSLSDTTPTSGSSKPVQSGGVYTALGNRSGLTWDSDPTSGSVNPVTSGGVYTALAGKVSKAGDSMTGQLNIDDGNIQIQKANDYPSLRIMAYNANSHDNFPSVMIQPNIRSSSGTQFSFFQSLDGSSWEKFTLPLTTSATQTATSEILTTRTFNAPEDFTNNSSAIEYSVAGYAKKCTRQGRICTIEYMSDSVAAANWTQGKLLFTLKAGYRPTITSYVVAAITATPYLALVQVGQDGTVRFYSANGTLSGNPRLYLNFSYSIA